MHPVEAYGQRLCMEMNTYCDFFIKFVYEDCELVFYLLFEHDEYENAISIPLEHIWLEHDCELEFVAKVVDCLEEFMHDYICYLETGCK